ncbi:MAG TPA: 2-C-methyl-D-erythritol 2,4-cyclodiphosphate synthase, partial [Gammaproteobacteria bacterium]|nr:2-C-methyl-D-erythritol 2,4-cyclodiphosphate synthase [Gammaproteobacteria bacterium]
MKVGQGFDSHKLIAGRRLILGGVDIPHDRGLEGHSDADVLVHAICDALLGAAGWGDIGQHFPDTDEQYAGYNSRNFLLEIRAKLDKAGLQIGNIDASIIAQAPRLSPYMEQMKDNLAA